MGETFEWAGWIRDANGFWRRVVQGRSITECAHLLEGFARELKPQPSNRDLCLTTGGIPNIQNPSRP